MFSAFQGPLPQENLASETVTVSDDHAEEASSCKVNTFQEFKAVPPPVPPKPKTSATSLVNFF